MTEVDTRNTVSREVGSSTTSNNCSTSITNTDISDKYKAVSRPSRNISEEKKRNIFTATNNKISENTSVLIEGTEKPELTFMSSSKTSDIEKESLLENEDVYARKCVEFLDILDFDDDELCEETLDYIDASI